MKSPEHFDPKDTKYKTIDDLPEKEKENFKKVKEGFVGKDAIDVDSAEGEASRMQAEVEHWGAKDYNEAESKVKKSMERLFRSYLKEGNISEAFDLRNEIHIPNSFIYSPENQEIAINTMTKKLRWNYGNLDEAVFIKNDFFVTKEIILSPEVKEAAIDRIEKALYWTSSESDGKKYANMINKVKTEFFISDELVNELIEGQIVHSLADSHSDKVVTLIKTYNLSKEFLSSERIIEAAKSAIIKNLSEENIVNAFKIKNMVNLSTEDVKTAEMAADKEGMLSDIKTDLDLINKTDELKKNKEKIISDRRQEKENNLSEMPPLFNEKEYKELDPDGLLKTYYEKEIKPYIQDGELKESEFLKNLRKNIYSSTFTTPYGGWRNTLCNKMKMKTADNISDYFERIAVSSIYFNNNRQIARQAVEKAFQLINNSDIEKISNKDGRCACSFVSHLGWVSNRLGLPDLADKFGKNTLCTNDPSYPGPAITMSKHGYGLNSIGEEHDIEIIKNDIMRHVEDQIKRLGWEKEKIDEK